MVLVIFKMIATSGFLAALECTKNRYRQGLRPSPHWGSLQRSPRPTSWFLRKRKGEEEGERKATWGTGPLSQIPGSVPGKHDVMTMMMKSHCTAWQ